MHPLIGAKTHFSLGESILPPKKLISQAAKMGYTHIAVTDTNGINAIPTLTTLGQEQENPIQIIAGTSIKVVDNINWRKPKKGEPKSKNPFCYISLFAMNQAGFKDIMKLLSLAHDPDHFYVEAQVSFIDVLETYKRGNVLLTTGSVYSLLQHKNYYYRLEQLVKLDRERLFVEMVPINTPYYERINLLASRASAMFALPVIYGQPTLFEQGKERFRDTMEAVLSNSQRDAPWLKQVPQGYDLKPWETVEANIKSLSGLFTRDLEVDTQTFIKLAAYRWEKFDVCLPKMAEDPFAELVKLCKAGWSNRIQTEVMGYKPEASKLTQYSDRLKYELMVIKKMGFSDYFLLVHDVVQWCHEQGIEVGPGRGSVGGSLIAYLMGITDVDPIRFGLFFERFINPERIDLPDIDLDFMSSRRQEVFEYLRNKYGDERVASISNYANLVSASTLRSVGKAHGLSEVDLSCSKLVPKEHGSPVSLEEAASQVPEIEGFAIAHPQIWEEATALQNVFRNYGQHAAGVIVAGEPVAERAVLFTRSGQTVNWDKRLVEDFGLVKLDILGLSTLDILAHARQYIKERHGKTIQLEKVPLDDPAVLEAFGKGQTVGIFQFESGGMRQLLKSLSDVDPLRFEDVTAATALYRPGPMDSGLMEKFVQIKQGNDEPIYLHPSMEPALKETYSVIVYQEQVMQIARDLAGFTMAESDKLRKVMGKKLPEEMKKFRDKWVDGCVSTSGLDKDVAGRLFDQVEKFAGYGFNKSHSVEYTVISYWAMWLKVNYPEEFFAAALTVLDEDKQKSLVRDADKHGIRVLPPDINKSSARFEIDYDAALGQHVLYAPFQCIKGLSEKASAAILEAKEKNGKPFESKQEFVDVVNRRACNVRGQERLDKVGAFARIEEGQQPASHPDRLKDQKELLPGVMIEMVKADRKITASNYIVTEIKSLVSECQECNKCTLAGTNHAMPRLGRSAKIMIVVDSPTWSECDAGKMGEGEGPVYLRRALQRAGISLKDVYLTSFVKAQKPKGGQLENEMIIGCSPYLDREIELLKPPVILAMGGKTARYLCPDIKGGWEEIYGKDQYDPKRDTTVLIGMNPMMVYADSRKQKMVDQIVKQAVELIT